MPIEHIKSFILILLISSSLMLTFALWSEQPNYQMSTEEEDLIDAELDGGTRLSRRDVIEPFELIRHDDRLETPIGLSTADRRTRLTEAMANLSLYNFSKITMTTPWYQEEANRVEVIYQTALPSAVITDLFNVDVETYIPTGDFNRVVFLEGHDMYQLLFVNDTDDEVMVANAQNFSQNMALFMQIFNAEEEPYRYLTYEGTRGSLIYLPENITKQTRLFAYTELDQDDFINLLFSKPSIVRSAYTYGGDTNYIDGTREMIVDGRGIEFTNPTNEPLDQTERISSYQLLDQVQSFINAHLGFTFREPFGYQLSDISQTAVSNEVKYILTYEDTPIFYDRDLTEITVRWHNESLYQYYHPLIMLLDQRGVGQTTYVPSAETVIDILDGPNYQGTAIYDVVLGYRLTEQSDSQGQVYALTPTWYVKGVYGYSPLVLPLEESKGGMAHAMGAN
ncbi:hypothetical protein GCM10012290_01920 [Halolactibacillus alkaliphilus]|uniref:Regulatory protein YycH domain-containing protein n=1 Tax=Halolactibacillus alkaliphilus TaxID=442899 RepID=A0A511X0J4_9BACI|nr:two-component system activity regulator YycH [Halolactibacillus alkaliphilus]GEN56440.1 hypothetical protein HAL01_09040 [Halolactibacillus alkaliphilus]GGN64424.1 hypothetical protein GCM10012290_01920 [Halolactibacillus alkaliphilus]SFO61118.1 Two-component signal transduction system YycFG, regulatory protein YycH [Halolactibacillus alkaliphilus]